MAARAPRRALALLVALGLGGAANAHVAYASPPALLDGRDAPEVILVLAGGVRGSRPSPMLEDRLTTALELYRAGAAPRLLLTGDIAANETPVMTRWLLDRGVPAAALLVDDEGVNTYSSMRRARDVFGVRRAVVVTQSFHLPRSLYIASALGLATTGSPAKEQRYSTELRHSVREILARPVAIVDCARERPAGRRPI